MTDNCLGIVKSDFPNIELADCNIWSFLRPLFEKWTQLPYLICSTSHKSYTYEEVFVGSLRWAAELNRIFHDREAAHKTVSIICANNVDYPIVFLGALAVGASVCPIRHDFDCDFVNHLLSETKTSVVVIDADVVSKYQDVLDKFEPKLDVYIRSKNEFTEKYLNLNQILFSNNEVYPIDEAIKVDAETTAIVTFSSGTTGKPKGILISQRSLVNNVDAFTHEDVFPLRSAEVCGQETICVTMPLAHSYGLQYISIAVPSKGGRTIVCNPLNVPNVLEAIRMYKPQVLKLNPYVIDGLNAISEKGTKDFDSVRVISNVGSPPNIESFKELNEKSGNQLFLHETYGASEMGVVSATPLAEQRLHMSGKLIPHAKMRIIDIETEESILEANKHGELLFKSTLMMKGYLNNPKATQDATFGDGWFRTGDIGYYDNDRFVKVIERYKDLINVDGKKVFCSKIEAILKQHDCVSDAGVVGVPVSTDSDFELPRAFVVCRSPVTATALSSFVKQNSPKEMWLEGGIDFVPDLPRNQLGKMVRKELRLKTWLADQ